MKYEITWNGFWVTLVANGIELDQTIAWCRARDPKAHITVRVLSGEEE